MVNPYLCKVFHTVAEYKSFSKASDVLKLKKSTVSRNIDQLEEELNVTLFYRNNKGVSLTLDGEKYFKFIDEGLGYLEAGEKLVKSDNNIENGEIIIGALSHISHFLLMDSIKKVKKDYPNLKVKIITGATGRNLIRLLEEHKIDFAIDSTTMSIDNKAIQKEELKQVENIFISKEPIKIDNIKDLEKMKLILGEEHTSTSQELFNLLKQYDVIITKPDMEIDITELKIKAVKMGLGISYVMKDAVINEIENNEIYEVQIPINLPTSSINILYLKGQLTKVDKKFIKEYLKNNIK